MGWGKVEQRRAGGGLGDASGWHLLLDHCISKRTLPSPSSPPNMSPFSPLASRRLTARKGNIFSPTSAKPPDLPSPPPQDAVQASLQQLHWEGRGGEGRGGEDWTGLLITDDMETESYFQKTGKKWSLVLTV